MIKIIVNYTINVFDGSKHIDKAYSLIFSFDKKEDVTNQHIKDVLRQTHSDGHITVNNMQLIH
jgi:hypothetical protein